MGKLPAILVLIASAFILGACAHQGGSHQGAQKKPCCESVAQGASVIYWCDCGPECKCNRCP